MQILYSKLSCKTEGEIMIFSNEAKLKEFVASKPTHKQWLMKVFSNRKEMLKGILEHQKGRTMERIELVIHTITMLLLSFMNHI